MTSDSADHSVEVVVAHCQPTTDEKEMQVWVEVGAACCQSTADEKEMQVWVDVVGAAYCQSAADEKEVGTARRLDMRTEVLD